MENLKKQVNNSIIDIVSNDAFDTYMITENDDFLATFNIFNENNTIKFSVDDSDEDLIAVTVLAVEWDIEKTIELFEDDDIQAELTETVRLIMTECFESTMNNYLN